MTSFTGGTAPGDVGKHSPALPGMHGNTREETIMISDEKPAAAGGTFLLGGDLPVHRLGYGAMRLTGPGTWGSRRIARGDRVLRRAVELGVNFIDTADSYGPYVSEQIIREALHPYDEGVVIATKGGITRQGPGRGFRCGRPEYLRQLTGQPAAPRVERIDLYQLTPCDPKVPLADQWAHWRELQERGQDPRTSDCPRSASSSSRRHGRSSRSYPCRTSTASWNARHRRAGVRGAPGYRFRPLVSAAVGRRATGGRLARPPPATTPPRASSPSPGCCTGRR